MKFSFFRICIAVVLFFAIPVHSQDSVAVTFRYKPQSTVSIVYIPGSFNNWANNVGGVISDTRFAMNYDGTNLEWNKTIKLIPGTYNYKFNENGNRWITDPNNPLVNIADNNNSIINVSDPMIFYMGYDNPPDQFSPYYIKCNFYTSDNNPIIPDSIYLTIGGVRKSNLASYYDVTKKLLRYPVTLGAGSYKVKIFAQNAKGVITTDSITLKISNAPAVKNLIPWNFIYDPKSSFNSYKNITSVNVPGVFNGWTPTSDPMIYDTYNEVWRKTINFLPGEYEYKYYINGSTWVEDADNPLIRTATGNSYITVDPITKPGFVDFRAVAPMESSQEFSVIYTIARNSYNIGIVKSSIKVINDGLPVLFYYDTTGQSVSVDIRNSMLSEGYHYLYFECTDSSGAKGSEYYTYGSFSQTTGYTKIDDYADEYLPYPDYIPAGSADINYFNVKANSTVDSLIFKIKMTRISDYTRIGFSLFNQISGKYGSQITSLNIHTIDWSDQGMFLILANPNSKYYDSTKQNILYLSSNPVTKGKRINVQITGQNEFIFGIACSDIDGILGNYNEKRYFSLYSFLCDESGAEYKSAITGALANQPYVYDFAFAPKLKQNIILNNHNETRYSRLDAENRGIAGVLPEQIDARLKNSGPIVKILSHSNSDMSVSYKIIEGTVNDSSINKVEIYRNNILFTSPSVTNNKYSAYIILLEGDNLIKAVAKNSEGLVGTSNIIRLKYNIDHSPKPVITFIDKGSDIELSALSSTDPDNDIKSYVWISDDRNNPIPLNINTSGASYSITKPNVTGEYYFNLKVTDNANNSSAVRNYFVLSGDGKVTLPNLASNPQWVKDAIVYEIFVKSFSPEGNIKGVIKQINYLKDLGINTLWLMPIMDNQGQISEMGGGYSIDDFYNIAPEYGTFDDFKTLIDSAHSNGMKIVLDITENHVADKHPWVEDVRSFGKYSNYFDFLETRKLGDDRGLGQTLNPDNIYMRYSNWTLANLNLEKDEPRNYMIKMFNWWLNEKNIDGFRFDVYWGPQNRYGKEIFWHPVRESLKKIKPDIFFLGETDGTGSGSEINYADMGGACDAAYDWNLFSAIKGIFGNRNLENLHNRITNYSYYPGDNSYFFRFLENHDEDRCATFFNNNQNKAALALLMTIPGIPMIYMGQEVGWKGKRNLISFSTSDSEILFPYYKRLIKARSKYPALRSKTLNRIINSDNEVYSFTRKYKDQNFLVVLNVSNSNKQLIINVNESTDLELSAPLSGTKQYYLNDFANDANYMIRKDDLKNLSLTLLPYEAKVMLLSDEKVNILSAVNLPENKELPLNINVSQNYPNPFNPTTTIEYTLPNASEVKIVVYDILGREVKTLVNEYKQQGKYRLSFDASSLSSGVYFYRLCAEKYSQTKKMVLTR